MSQFFLLVVLLSMIIYQIVIPSTQGQKDELGNVTQTFNQKVTGYIYTSVYSAVVIIFGMIYKFLANNQTQKENHRYQKDFDDALITRLFQFNFFNFYMPMLLVAFYTRNYDNLFMMMLS